jgi:murein DD-endopeptidase MepM/ murein hydrolase activator NlpD
MRTFLKYVLVLHLAAGMVAVLAYWMAGRVPGPAVEIDEPQRLLGRSGVLEISIEAPAGTFERLEASLAQADRTFPLLAIAAGQGATATDAEVEIRQDGDSRIRVTRPIGREALPDLRQGPARLSVTAARTTLFGLRTRETTVERDVEVRLTPPRLAVLSTHHHVNHGGSELVVFRVTPADSEAGVIVGDREYPGFSAVEAGMGGDPAVRLAFFALLHDQDLSTPVSLFARDPAGNRATAAFDYRVFPKAFRRGRIELSDSFLQRVVPPILDQSPAVQAVVSSPEDLLPAFLEVNRELRKQNAEQIASFAKQTAPRQLWSGPFHQLGSSAVQSGFADHRSYFYGGREVDQQVHLGYDLAVTAAIPILAANAGTVLFADYLGIYGNTVIIDHGLGVQSLYAHLSSIEVESGDAVEKNQRIGRSGMTGLAGGDHLHFTVLLNGHPVNPVEWWDSRWMEDRVQRKLRDLGGQAGLPGGQ